jgi:hypothetical protein
MSTPALKLNGDTILDEQPTAASSTEQPTEAPIMRPSPARNDTTYSKYSQMSVPPEGSILTGKQEHCGVSCPAIQLAASS